MRGPVIYGGVMRSVAKEIRVAVSANETRDTRSPEAITSDRVAFRRSRQRV